jgi:hypothetical protein
LWEDIDGDPITIKNTCQSQSNRRLKQTKKELLEEIDTPLLEYLKEQEDVEAKAGTQVTRRNTQEMDEGGSWDQGRI